MSIIRAVDGQDTGFSAQPAEKKKSAKSKSSASSSRPAATSTDQRFEELDQKWLDRFNRLEALLLAKTLDQPQPEPTFNTVKVAPAHPPPANVIRSKPFIKPSDQSSSQPTDRPSVAASTNPPALIPQAATSERPSTSVSSASQLIRRNTTSESDSDGVVSDRPPVDIFVEEGENSQLLANVARPGCRSESSSNFDLLSDPAKSDKKSNCHKLFCKSPQESLLVGGIAVAYRQKCSRTGAHSKITGVFQPTIFSSKTQQQVETYTRFEQTKIQKFAIFAI